MTIIIMVLIYLLKVKITITGSSPKREQVFCIVFMSHRSWNSGASSSLPSLALPLSVSRKPAPTPPDSGGGVPDIGCNIIVKLCSLHIDQ